MKKILKSFKRLDVDKSGDLDINEFIKVPELSGNPLVKRVV